MTSPSWVPSFTLGELEDGPLRFEHGSRGVLVALVDGQPHAVSDACLHKGASLSAGTCAGVYVTCPSHWWRYDLRDGSLQGTPGARLECYACRVVDGRVEVELPQELPEPSLRQILLAHARAGRSDRA